jgi:Na+/pantothenate symporter
VIYIILGSITAVLSSIALFSPRKPWSWVLGVVLLAIGIVGICFLPSLLMLIFWTKPETRAYFGRKMKK